MKYFIGKTEVGDKDKKEKIKAIAPGFWILQSVWKGHWKRPKRPKGHFGKIVFTKTAFWGAKKSKLKKTFLTKVLS